VTAISHLVKNVVLVDDAGGQVGTTINTPPSGNTCDNTTDQTGYTSASNGTITSATVGYVDCFGTASSPVNYIIPANTTRVLSLKADIQSGATFGTVVGSLLSEASNLQGLISSQTGSSAGTQGSSLSLQTSLLAVSANAAFGAQSVTPNSTNAKVGSFAFTASSASGAQINTLSVKAAPGGSGSADLQNLKIMIGSTQFGTTQGVVTDASTYTFSGAPFTVPAGGTTYVDVYADVLSNASSLTPATQLTACSGTGLVSYSALSCSGTTGGQNLTVVSGGASTTIGLDSSAPAASQLVMGSTGNVLAAYRFAETSNVENVKITDLTLTQNTTSTKANFQNVSLYQGSTLLGTGGSASSVTGGYAYVFHFGTPIIVPRANSVTVTLKGDVASYSSQGASDNTSSTFTISNSNVTALGASSNAAAALTGSATGNLMTVLRTTLTPSATALGTVSGRVKSSVDNLATITFTANSAGSAMLRTLKLTFNGNAVSSTALAAATSTTFVLRDANNGNVLTVDNATLDASSCAGTSNTCALVWTFSTSTTSFVISGGTSYTFTVQADDTNLAAASGSNSISLGTTIQAVGDVTYYDNGDGTGSTISLPSTVVPMNVSTVTFAAGS